MRIYLRYMRKSIINALFSKTRQAILSTCLLHPEKWWYLSDLAHHLKLTPSSLQRELAGLSESNILQTRKDGNRIYYKANITCPGVQELQLLFIKTVGITDVVALALKRSLPNIELAFIYGSMARGEAIHTSDVDLMIVGEVKLIDITQEIKAAEKKLGREINPTLYSQKEFQSKIQSKDAFISTVLGGSIIFIKGNQNEIKAMVG